MKQSYTEQMIDPKTNDNKKKVLMYYSYGNKIGGPLTYINTIINSPLKEKYEFVTCYQNKAPGGWDGEMLKEMTDRIKAEKPEIVHIHGAQSEGFYGVLAAKKAGVKKIVMTIHGFAFDDSNCKGVKHFLYKNIVEPYSIRNSDNVYCVCEYASKRDIVKKNAGKRSFGYIHNCVPQLHIKENRESIRSRLNINENDVVFCISGRVTKEKGFDILEKVVKGLREAEETNFKLMVLGDGPYSKTFKENLKKEVEKGQVILVGQTNQVADYLAASDVFIFPSYHENLSIALLEAGASGLPAIVANVGGNPEIIKNNETGFVIDGFEYEKYLEKVKFFLNNPDDRISMGIKVKKDITDRFSLELMCGKIDEVYKL
ncbi:MAG: glycosyltransferase [Clostridia bacterium]|nr:glycosyltransferase [Clostridia bacterium]